jgi:hypothetical protein
VNNQRQKKTPRTLHTAKLTLVAVVRGRCRAIVPEASRDLPQQREDKARHMHGHMSLAGDFAAGSELVARYGALLGLLVNAICFRDYAGAGIAGKKRCFGREWCAKKTKQMRGTSTQNYFTVSEKPRARNRTTTNRVAIRAHQRRQRASSGRLVILSCAAAPGAGAMER